MRFAVLLMVVAVTLPGCVSSQETGVPPSIAVSPEDLVLFPGDEPPPVTGALGLMVSDHESDSLEQLEVLPGARVSEVVPGGAAALAGLRVGDVILSVNDVTTNGRDAFETVIRDVADGARLRLEVRRDTTAFATHLDVQRAPAGAAAARKLYRVDPVRTRAGYRSVLMEEQGARRTAAEVVKLFPRSPLPEAGVQPGDRILAVNGVAVASAHDLVRRLLEDHEPGQNISVDLARGDARHTVELELWAPPRKITRVTVPIIFDYECDPGKGSLRWTFVNLWIFPLLGYERDGGEREYRFLLFRFGTGFGELVEESP